MSSGRLPEQDEAFVALGSNQGDRVAALRAAVRGLKQHGSICDIRPSPVYESEAHTLHPGEEQPDYLNAVVQLLGAPGPEALLRLAWKLEGDAGRERTGEETRWQSRPLDVDLLVVGPSALQTDRLCLPHPRLAERRFVLRPWADLVPNLRVPPPFEKQVSVLLAQCPDRAALHRASLTL